MPRVTKEQKASLNVRAALSREGVTLWRNNVGAGYFRDGTFVRFGLANESKEMNRRLKSSDFIGIRKVTITPEMVGGTIGQFVAREIKPPGWEPGKGGSKNRAREEAQQRFIDLINSHGGDADFATGEDE